MEERVKRISTLYSKAPKELKIKIGEIMGGKDNDNSREAGVKYHLTLILSRKRDLEIVAENKKYMKL